MVDWSGQVHVRVRRFVKMNACPTCKVRAGLPCKNTASELPEAWEMFPDRKRTFRNKKRQPFYFHRVHASRKRVAQK